MKLIDLFAKIANGEKVPDIIKFHGRIFKTNGKEHNYYCAEEEKILEEFFIFEELNDEVEIIEDTPNKIKHINLANVSEEKRWFAFRDKINEIIDKINGE